MRGYPSSAALFAQNGGRSKRIAAVLRERVIQQMQDFPWSSSVKAVCHLHESLTRQRGLQREQVIIEFSKIWQHVMQQRHGLS
jgi:hypothetical protein